MDSSRSEQLIKDFHHELCRQGMSRQMAVRHRDKLRFFLHAYLAEQWPRDIDRIDGEIIRDFLGAWFLRHVGGSKADLAAFLNTFRRFYDFLYHAGITSGEERDEVCMVCEGRGFFMDRYDEYFNPVPGVWERPGSGMALPEGDPAGRYNGPVDRQLWMLAKNLDKTGADAVLDFALFLDYLANNPVRLTKSNSYIPRKHASRINCRFSSPEKVPSTAGMKSYKTITWFYHLALELGLATKNGKNSLELGAPAEAFLDLEPDVQLTLIIDATWNRISWAALGAGDQARVSRWAQEHRDGFAALMSGLTPNREWVLDPEPGVDRQEALLARYVLFHEVVESQVLFALNQTGILDYSGTEGEEFRIGAISITRFGRQVMRLFARRSYPSGHRKQGPVDRLQECLFV